MARSLREKMGFLNENYTVVWDHDVWIENIRIGETNKTGISSIKIYQVGFRIGQKFT